MHVYQCVTRVLQQQLILSYNFELVRIKPN